MSPRKSTGAGAAKDSPAQPTKSNVSTSSNMRQPTRRSTRSAVVGLTGSGEDNPVTPVPAPDKTDKTSKHPRIEVAVPVSNATSQYAALSSSTSSREASVFDKGSTGYDGTPGTTVSNPTPAESEAPGSSRRPNKKVNASARAAQLRNGPISSRNGTTKKRSAASMVDEDADAALARTLQEEEYKRGHTAKKPKISKKGTKPNNKPRVIADYADDDSEFLSDLTDLSDLSSIDALDDLSPAPKSKSKHRRNHLPGTISHDWIPDMDEHGPVMDLLPSETDDDDYDDTLAPDGEIPDVEDQDDNDDPTATLATSNNRRSTHLRRQASGRPRIPRAQRERMKLEKRHPVVKSMWKDLKDTPVMTPTPDPQPAAISRRLKPFQLEGLNWMRRQEQSVWKGGLLGDEMGMGKTIQAVSLIMSDYPAGKPSLVVVPPVALIQWSAEIDAYTDRKLKLLVYHNSNSKVKHLTAKELKGYDVIMISYSGLESMHRKEVKGWSRNRGLVKEDSVIHSIDFHRLILDEAHSIKQRTTSVARACFALKSQYKWCLSGTPVQNRIGEFFSLLRFLEVRPFACYFCKECPCKELHWSQDEEKRCTHCRHSGFQHVSIFNQEILNPITESNAKKRKEALDKLRLLTDRIMLRRVKKDHTASMELPPKRIEIHNEFFGEIERDFSSSIMTNSARQFDTYVSRGVMLNNYANIFGLIMQMRQVANHPDLILKKHAEGGQNVLVCSICDEPAEEAIRSRCRHEFCRQCVKDYIKSFESGGEPDCPRCHIPLSIDFEQPDIDQHDEVKKNSIINRIRMDDWTSSTKIEMLIYDLYKLRSKKQTHKSIVFSQFTSMLQLVEWRLRRAGITTVMLDGSMTPAQRQKSIEYFMNNVDAEVFLVSLKAGGVALNLTEASRVFIVDPWWNPAAEWQSADRCHRIGQRRPCVITRLCIEDSVESRMVLLQEKKANMINGTLNKDQSEALEKLTPEDMEFLFRGN